MMVKSGRNHNPSIFERESCPMLNRTGPHTRTMTGNLLVIERLLWIRDNDFEIKSKIPADVYQNVEDRFRRAFEVTEETLLFADSNIDLPPYPHGLAGFAEWLAVIRAEHLEILSEPARTVIEVTSSTAMGIIRAESN